MLFGWSTGARDGALGLSCLSGLVVAGFAVVILAAGAMMPALPADAAGNQEGEERTGGETAPRDAGEPIMAIVSIKSQQVTIYDADGWILRAPVSSGVTGRETPAGVFAVVEKDKDHHSSLYDDAWMPNMQRITWSGIALHGGPLPGYAASHGCIRLPYAFAEKLFDKTQIGLRVIISPTDAEPVDFSDPKLFVPNPETIAAAPAKAEVLAKEAAEAEDVAKDAKTAAAAAPRAAKTAVLTQRRLESEKTVADSQLASADKALAAAETDQTKAQDAEHRTAAKVEELASKLDGARADAKAKQDAIKALPAKAEALAKEAAEAEEIAEAAKTAAAAAPRAAMMAVLSQRQLESEKAMADTRLASADKVLAATKTDRAKAQDTTQKAAAKVEDLASKLVSAVADAKAKQDAIKALPVKAAVLAKEAAEAEGAAKGAKTAAAAAPRAAMMAALTQRRLELEKTIADAQLASAGKVLVAVRTAKARDAKQKAVAKVEELAGKLDAAKADAKAKQDAIKALPVKAEALAKEAAEADEIAKSAKTAAAAAPRAAAMAVLTRRRLELEKTVADAEFALADKALATAETDQAKAQDGGQMTAAKVEELASKLDSAKADANAKQDAIKALPRKAEALAKEAAEAEEIAKGAKTAAAAAPRAAMMAALTERRLELEKTATDAQLAFTGKVLAATKTNQVKVQDAEQKASAKVEELASKLGAARAGAMAEQDAVKALQDASNAAHAKMTETAKAAREAKLVLEPISIFVSRATQKLYARRSTHSRVPDGGEMFDTILEVPVTIRNPGKPIGTHVFTAVARTEAGGLRWTAVTIDGSDNAKDALYRVTIPQDVLDRIAPTTLPRSSIVISDEPLNRETNYRTEFVVVLNNQPQGGLAMRERSDETRRNNVALKPQPPQQPRAPRTFFEQLFGIARPEPTFYRRSN